MEWQNSFLVIPLLISAIIAFYVASIVRNFSKLPIFNLISLLLIAAGFWSVLYSLELWSSLLPFQILIGKLEYIAICLIPPLWLRFCLRFSKLKRSENQRFALFYSSPFLISLIVIFTNDLHHWFWQDSSQIIFEGAAILTNRYGFWFWIHSALSYIYILTGSILVIKTLFQRKRITVPVILVGMGVLLPLLGNILFIFKFQTPFDFTPIVITLSGVMFAVSMIRFNFFNIKPIAKSTLFSTLSDPVFFISNEHIVIEANRAAQELFEISTSSFGSESIDKIISEKTGTLPVIDPAHDQELRIETVEGTVYYRAIATPVYDHKKVEGVLLTLKEITAEKTMIQGRTREIEAVSFLNQVSELCLNSTNIEQLQDHVMKKITSFSSAELVFMIRNCASSCQTVFLADRGEVPLISLGINDFSRVIERVFKEKKTVFYSTPEQVKKVCKSKQPYRSLCVFPLLDKQEWRGVLAAFFSTQVHLDKGVITIIEQALIQTMISMSRLLVLEDLENQVIERTEQRNKLNAELEQNYIHLNQIVDTSPNLVFSLSPQEEILFCNKKFIHDFGITEKRAVIGKPISEVFKNRDQKLLNQIIQINRNGERSGQYECTLQLTSGYQKEYLLNKSISYSADVNSLEFIYIMIDLTKQKKQEIKLRNSEQRLLNLFESMPVIVFEQDHSAIKSRIDQIRTEYGDQALHYLQTHPAEVSELANKIVVKDCNQLAQDFYGFEKKEDLFKEYPRLVAKSGTDSLLLQLESYLEEKTEFEIEATRIKSSGEVAFVKIRSHIPKENQQDFGKVLVSVVDITARRNIEKALASSEEKFRSIIQQSIDGIILFDQSGRIIEWNDAAERMTGYTMQDLANLSISKLIRLLVQNEKDELMKKPDKELLHILLDRYSSYHNQVLDLILTTKTKNKVAVSAIISSLEIAQDYVGSIILRDISMVKKTEAEVKRLASAAHEISEGLVVANHSGETEYVNLAVERITGYQREELIGKNLLLFLQFEKSNEEILQIRKTLQEGKVLRGKTISQKKDGSSFTLQYSITPIMDEQGNKNFVSVLSDISQSELLEQQNRQAQKLEAIGSLAAGVAHEINTPTQYVGNNLVFIRDGFNSFHKLLEANDDLWQRAVSANDIQQLVDLFHQEEANTDIKYLSVEIPKAIDESLEGINRVTKIVQAIKEFSHPSMDEMTPIDLNRAIDTTITVSRNEWKYVADLIPHFAADLPTVICSPGEINQVILNLITNAAHAIKEQIAKAVYKKGLIEIYTYKNGNFVEIQVKDNGGGIPVAYQEKVFDPFFTTKPVGMGTGQGLSISHKVIVNKHHGKLAFSTEVGSGTTFTISLPIEQAETHASLVDKVDSDFSKEMRE